MTAMCQLSTAVGSRFRQQQGNHYAPQQGQQQQGSHGNKCAPQQGQDVGRQAAGDALGAGAHAQVDVLAAQLDLQM